MVRRVNDGHRFPGIEVVRLCSETGTLLQEQIESREEIVLQRIEVCPEVRDGEDGGVLRFEGEVEKHHGLVSFVLTPEAEQWRKTRALMEAKGVGG